VARHQYRMTGDLDWQSNSGNALCVLFNPQGSGKKVTIRSFEATNLTAVALGVNGSIATQVPLALTLARVATAAGGDLRTMRPMDSAAGEWPSTVAVTTGAAVTTPTTVRQIMVSRQTNSASLSWLARNTPTPQGRSGRGLFNRPRRGPAPLVEGLVVRAGESVALIVAATPATISTMPLRVTATLHRAGSPGRTYTTAFYARTGPTNTALFAVANAAGSGETITVLDVAVEEVGTYDSPYFQVVPVGSIEAGALSDPTRVIPLVKMDTASPDPGAYVKALQDVPILPFGLPENAIADASTGSPKGMNYLKTKDFLGPVYRTLFPEAEGTNNHAQPSATQVMDGFGHHGHVAADLMFRRAGITLREGEGIALVSGAETAVLSQAVGVSGWSSWQFGAQIDVESRFAPTLTISGLRAGTEVRVFRTSDDAELAGTESSGTTFTYDYEWDGADTNVYIVVHALGYLPIRYTNQALGSGGVSILVQQSVDRQYANI
jgi:hypothetical protein